MIGDLAGFGEALKAALGAGDVAALQIRLKPASDDEIIAAPALALMPIAQAQGRRRHPQRPARPRRPAGVATASTSARTMRLTRRRGRIDGRERMVGVTCHDSKHLAMEAAEAGADYVAFGAFFPTHTKEAIGHPDLELLEDWHAIAETPWSPSAGSRWRTPRRSSPPEPIFLPFRRACGRHADGAAAAVRAFNAEFSAPRAGAR